MFSQDEKEKKLDWMYKGPNSMVNREDYLLGRSVDKTLEQLNEEEKQKQLGVVPPKNRVEHECIPPSIRDFNKIVHAEQVDLSTKLQEDPLVAIKKREEECRRQFLQNPVQLKKLQKALKAQEEKKNKLKKKKHSKSKNEHDLDTILMHKFNQFKHMLTEEDMKEIMEANDESNSSSDDDYDEKKDKNKKNKSKKDKKHKRANVSDEEQAKKTKHKSKVNDSSASESSTDRKRRKYDSESDSDRHKNKNWGLTKSDGSKITLKHNENHSMEKEKPKKTDDDKAVYKKSKKQRLTEDEKERKRQEMMKDAVERDKERSRNLKRHREIEKKESKQMEEFDTEFAHKQYIKSANSSSIESRIKSNLNKIQRSGREMDKNFSKR